MTTLQNIWDDSECVVEEEYNTPPTVKTPHLSNEFKNVLIVNKGDITTARKFTFSSVKSSKSDTRNSSSHEVSKSDTPTIENLQMCEVKNLRKKIYSEVPKSFHQRSCREPKLWSEL